MLAFASFFARLCISGSLFGFTRAGIDRLSVREFQRIRMIFDSCVECCRQL